MDPDKMTAAQVWEVADGYKRERDAALLKLDETQKLLSAARGEADFNNTRALEAEQRLADIRHAMEHAEEIGRMDHYAANTIKQAVKL